MTDKNDNSTLHLKSEEGNNKGSPEEKMQEEPPKSIPKYPHAIRPLNGHHELLQRRLSKGQKYFDSGDYQMAKQGGKGKQWALPHSTLQPAHLEIPTPESIPVRKSNTTTEASKLATKS